MTQHGKNNMSHGSLNQAHLPCRWMNNLTLGEYSFAMKGRVEIGESKSTVAINGWQPHAGYHYDNCSDTSCLKQLRIDRPCQEDQLIFLIFRYYAILHPLRAKTLCTTSHTRRMIIGIWLISLFLALPTWHIQVIFSYEDNGYF